MTSRFQPNPIAWLLVLLSVLTITSVFILAIFGFGEISDDIIVQPDLIESSSLPDQDTFNTQHVYIKNLQSQIQAYKLKIQRLEFLLKGSQKRALFVNTSSTVTPPMRVHIKVTTPANASNRFSNFDCTAYIRKQVGEAEIFHGHRFNNEFEIIPFDHFTFNRIFPIQAGLQKSVALRPIGRIRGELVAAISRAIESLNKKSLASNQGNRTGPPTEPAWENVPKFTFNDFLEGIYRIDPKAGIQYELYFQRQSEGPVWKNIRKVIVVKPFAPHQTVDIRSITNPTLLVDQHKRTDEDIIHIIVPLAGRLPQLAQFLKNFIDILINKDDLINLTVVYFGYDGFAEAKQMLEEATLKLGPKKASKIQMVHGNETFSRAKGLRIGAENCIKLHKTRNETNALLFLCDVDIIFNEKFLNRCRWNSAPGKMAYFPVVFSLYNPHVVFTLQGKKIPNIEEQMQITREHGFWRDFGFGMTCQYRSDFLELGGFDQELVGWGGEDVMLYRKYIRSSLRIIRATDPGIFHMWHSKECEQGKSKPKLSMDQYMACIISRALTEASHAQLGYLAFRNEAFAAAAAADAAAASTANTTTSSDKG